jgi:hypothetical protein
MYPRVETDVTKMAKKCGFFHGCYLKNSNPIAYVKTTHICDHRMNSFCESRSYLMYEIARIYTRRGFFRASIKTLKFRKLLLVADE